MTRELVNPQWDVSADNGGGVIMRLVVPGSKFGAVHIRLDGADARELAARLTHASETKPGVTHG